jgi:hypothetical protein
MEYDSAPVDYFGCVVIDAGVVAREYGKPCVASIQGIITTLQDANSSKSTAPPVSCAFWIR